MNALPLFRRLSGLLGLTFAASQAAGAPLTSGNLLIYAIDNGGASLNGSATPVLIREVTTAGTLIQNITLPSTGAGAFTASGTAASDGQLVRSADGAIATFAGYNVTAGTTSVVSGTVLRLYAMIDPSGTVSYSAPYTISNTNVRGAIASSAATGFYVFTGDGIGYATSLSAPIYAVTGQYTVRGATIFNGQLYSSTGATASNNGVNKLRGGLPTGPAYYDQLPGFTNTTNDSPNAIRFHDFDNNGTPETLYVALGRVGGGVQRYNFNGTSWVLAYTLNPATPIGYYGLTSRIDTVDPTKVRFYATTQPTTSNGGQNQLVTFTDSAVAGNTTSPGPITSTTLRTAPVGQMFRGVDFTPVVAKPLVAGPAATAVTGTSATLGGNVTSDGSSAITARGIVYAPTATNANPQIGGTGVVNLSASAATGPFSVSASMLTQSTGYSFAAYATNTLGTTYSTVGTFTTGTPPLFTSANTTIFTIGANGSFTLTASGSPAPAIALTSGSLPNSVSYTAATGVLAGTPAAGTGGSYPLTFTASNAALPNATQNFTLVINRPPVAGADTLATTRNMAVSLPVARLLINDNDPDGDALSVTGADATSAQGGTVGLAAGILTYTPASGFTGTDSFNYSISDGRGGNASATVMVTVVAGSAPSQNLVSLSLGAGGAQIQWRGIVGQNYRIDYSDDLGGSWQSFPGTLTAGATGAIDYLDASLPLPPQRFYRTVAVP